MIRLVVRDALSWALAQILWPLLQTLRRADERSPIGGDGGNEVWRNLSAHATGILENGANVGSYTVLGASAAKTTPSDTASVCWRIARVWSSHVNT
jgi:hypothetical protein